MQQSPEVKYFAYLRKSTEDEERQVLSIPTQKEKILETLGELDIEFVEETRSAFLPDNRPKFADMVRRIKRGERQGMIAWHPDRISRNELDAATVTYMLRTGHLRDLKFGSYHFDNSPEGIWMLQMALSQSQYSSAKLSKDVKRGMDKKVKMGWRPGIAPLGYLNDKSREKGMKKVLVDPERFPLMRKMVDLMLTGSYRPSQILKVATDEWGLTTRRHKKKGGGPLSTSCIYKFFTNSFYAGVFEWNGEQYQGRHTPMMTLGEYDRIQSILGAKGKPRSKRHEFAFTGLIRCGDCGCSVTAETKRKLLAKGEERYYTYYHCTRKKRDVTCFQRRYLRAEALERQIEHELRCCTIRPEFKDWAFKILNRQIGFETEFQRKVVETQRNGLVQSKKELENLTRMRYRDLIDDEAFLREGSLIKGKITRLEEQLRNPKVRVEKLLVLAEKTFQFATHAAPAFSAGGPCEKREILVGLGSNFVLADSQLTFQVHPWLQPIREAYSALEDEYARLEPPKSGRNEAKSRAIASVVTRWSGVVEDVRTAIEGADCVIRIPDLR